MSGKTRSSLSAQHDKCTDCGDNPAKCMCENFPEELCKTDSNESTDSNASTDSDDSTDSDESTDNSTPNWVI